MTKCIICCRISNVYLYYTDGEMEAVMGILKEVKCKNCDRRYSPLLSKCPYCHARRGKQGKRSRDNDNSGLKVIVGLLLLLILIVAVVVLLVSSLKAEKTGTETDAAQVEGTVQTEDAEEDREPGALRIRLHQAQQFTEAAPRPRQRQQRTRQREQQPREDALHDPVALPAPGLDPVDRHITAALAERPDRNNQ